MEKVIVYAFLSFIFYSCATDKISNSSGLSELDLADSLWENVDQKECGDSFLKKTKAQLVKSNSNKTRIKFWYSLGRCYLRSNNFQKAMYYYDLYIGSNEATEDKKSSIYYNIGQFHEMKNLPELAIGYYQKSLAYNKKNNLAKYSVSFLYLSKLNAKDSYPLILDLIRAKPKSKKVREIYGVTLFLLNKSKELNDKVLSYFNEKSSERVLFEEAKFFLEKRNLRDHGKRLSSLELNSASLKNLRSLLLGWNKNEKDQG